MNDSDMSEVVAASYLFRLWRVPKEKYGMVRRQQYLELVDIIKEQRQEERERAARLAEEADYDGYFFNNGQIAAFRIACDQIAQAIRKGAADE